MARPRHVHTFPHQLAKIHSDAIPLFLVPRLPSLQNLFDSAEQAIGIVEHQAVELPVLRLVMRMGRSQNNSTSVGVREKTGGLAALGAFVRLKRMHYKPLLRVRMTSLILPVPRLRMTSLKLRGLPERC